MAKMSVVILGNATGAKQAFAETWAAAQGFNAKAGVLANQMGVVGKKMTTHLTLPIAAIGAVSVKAATDFQSSMTLLTTQAGVAQNQVAGLSQGVLGLAGKTATAPDELAKGIYHLASQGLRGKQALDALRIAAEGAKVGQANLEDVTNALGGVLASNIKGASNLNQAMGMLNATVGAGDMRMQDLADAMGTGLAANAAVAKVGLKDVSAALAVFGDNNIRGAKAGTALGSALRLMSAPSSTAQKELATIGIGASDMATRLAGPGGLVAALEYLQQKMDAAGMSGIQQGQLLSNAFGGKQATGVKLLLDELDRLKKKEADVGAGANSFGSAWQNTTQTTAFKVDQMKASMDAAAIKIGASLLPIVAKLAGWLAKAAGWFSSLGGHAKDFVLIAGGVLAALGPVLSIFSRLYTVVNGLGKALVWMAGKLGLATAAEGEMAVGAAADEAAVAGIGVAASAALGPLAALVAALVGARAVAGPVNRFLSDTIGTKPGTAADKAKRAWMAQYGIMPNPYPAKSPKPKPNAQHGAGIPRHASGGIFTMPHLAWIAENGPEAVVPLRGGSGGGSDGLPLSSMGRGDLHLTVLVPLTDGRMMREQRKVALRSVARGTNYIG